MHGKPKYHGMENPCDVTRCMEGFCRDYPNGTTECVHVPEPCAIPMCSADYDPVCGTNGETYANSCLLQADTCPNGVRIGLKKAHNGPCIGRVGMCKYFTRFHKFPFLYHSNYLTLAGRFSRVRSS